MKIFDIQSTFALALFFFLTKPYTLNSTVYKAYNIYTYSLTLVQVYCVVFWGLLFPFFFSYRFCFALAFRLERTICHWVTIYKKQKPWTYSKILTNIFQVRFSQILFFSEWNYSLTFTFNTSFLLCKSKGSVSASKIGPFRWVK